MSNGEARMFDSATVNSLQQCRWDEVCHYNGLVLMAANDIYNDETKLEKARSLDDWMHMGLKFLKISSAIVAGLTAFYAAYNVEEDKADKES